MCNRYTNLPRHKKKRNRKGFSQVLGTVTLVWSYNKVKIDLIA